METLARERFFTPQPIAPSSGDDEQLLYFTSSSLTLDDRVAILIRETDGNANLCARDLTTGESKTLTHNNEGSLKSYVYFDGYGNRGLGKASISLDPQSGCIYYIQGTEIRRVDPGGTTQSLAILRDDEVTAFTHISGDGRYLCVPTTDGRALEGPFVDNRPTYDIDQKVQDENLLSYLNIFDSQTGKLVHLEVVPRAWITHVQFCPMNPKMILYNHEWASNCGVRRMWLWDGTNHRPLRHEDERRSRGDWVCHEMWSRDGQSIIFHGQHTPAAIR